MVESLDDAIGNQFPQYIYVEDKLKEYSNLRDKNREIRYQWVLKVLLSLVLLSTLSYIYESGTQGVDTPFIIYIITGVISFGVLAFTLFMTGVMLYLFLDIVNDYMDSSILSTFLKYASALGVWVLPKTHRLPQIERKHFYQYWLYKMWVNRDDTDELDYIISDYLDWVRCPPKSLLIGEPVYNLEIALMTRDLEANPNFRTDIVADRLPGIMRRLLEREYDYTRLSNRGSFIVHEHDDYHINTTIQELNDSYRYNLNGTVGMLSRKLVENLLIDLYKKHGHRLAFFDTDRGRPKTLGALKEQVDSDKKQFEQYSSLGTRDFVESIGRVQELGNHYIHNSEQIQSKRDLTELQEELQYICEVIHRLDEKLEESDAEIEYTEE